MTVVVLLLCLLLASGTGFWLARRRRDVLIWDRELDAAFHGRDQRQFPRHRLP
jgi:hypothetical protein